MGIRIQKLELIGTGLIIGGCVAMLLDPRAMRKDGETSSWWEDIIIILSSVPAAFFFLLNSKLVKKVPIFTLLLIMNIHSFIVNALLAKITDPYKVEMISINPEYGCFGFFNPSSALIAFVPYGICSSLFGSAGYVISLLFFSPLVVTNAFLTTPFVA